MQAWTRRAKSRIDGAKWAIAVWAWKVFYKDYRLNNPAHFEDAFLLK